MKFNRKTLGTLFLAATLMGLWGCANFRAYYNAYFNAEKAFKRAHKLKIIRLKKNPLDSVEIAEDEKKQFERAIAKASKVLELYSERENKYLPKSLFIIGESYLKLKEYGRAIVKYEELEKGYPDFEKMPLVKFHKAKCLFLSAPYPEAKQALLDFIAATKNPEFRREAMNDLAQLERENGDPQASLAAYNSLLQEKGLTPEFRASVYYEAAKLAYDIKSWENCRAYALAKEIKILAPELQFSADFLAAKSLYFSGEEKGGIGELENIMQNKLYTAYLKEAQLLLAEWYFAGLQYKKAVDLLETLILAAPKTGYAAEAYYHLAMYTLKTLLEEEQALGLFDSSAACGDSLEFAQKSKDKAASLKRLFELRGAKSGGQSMVSISQEFYMAELFLFELDNPDSAISHMNNIVADTTQDSLFSIKAAYARAYISDEFKKGGGGSDSLYKYVLENYPGTEYAKQAEYNLGLVPKVKTREDEAHQLFLEAEQLNFDGYDLNEKVLPAFQKVVDTYPGTEYAAKAQFVLAMLYERDHVMGNAYSQYKAKLAHAQIRKNHPGSDYYQVSHQKLLEAGIQPGDSIVWVPPADSGAAQSQDSVTISNADSLMAADTASTSKETYSKESFEQEDIDSKEILDTGGSGNIEDEYY